MKILIHAIHYPVCSARYAVDAFKRLGHDVCHIGQYTGREIWGMEVPAEYTWLPEPPAPDWSPDIAILMDTAYQWHYEGDAPTIVWSVDNHIRDSRQLGIDHYFLAHKSVSVMAWEYRVASPSYAPTGMSPMATAHLPAEALMVRQHQDMTWLPCAYDPVAFPPSPIAWADRKYDVCMIGVMYPKRWELVNAMRAAGLKVFAGTGLIYDAYRDAYHNSRVALVSSACGDLPIRLFEGAGMGCAVLCDEIRDLRKLDVVPPAVEYLTADKAVEFAKDIANLPSALGEERAAFSALWAKYHTWDKRAQVIVDWAEARS